MMQGVKIEILCNADNGSERIKTKMLSKQGMTCCALGLSFNNSFASDFIDDIFSAVLADFSVEKFLPVNQ